MRRLVFYLWMIFAGGATVTPATGSDFRTYVVEKLPTPVSIDAVWEKEPWRHIAAMELDNFMGDRPAHFPQVLAKVAYDDDAIYVIFQVHDRYVLALTEEYQGSVYKDSCVEFFFTPNENVGAGYFNLETNCGGTALFQHQKARQVEVVEIARADFDQITIAHSMPKIVSAEIPTDTTWTVEYRLPFFILEKYAQVIKPAAGVIWRANFYKCADNSSHPHWLTWSPVVYSQPNFHLPAYFGALAFGLESTVAQRAQNSFASFDLSCYPNPFNSQTAVRFELPEASAVDLTVYDLSGKKVTTLLHEFCAPGLHNLIWDVSSLASGAYFCRLSVDGAVEQQKITLVR